MILGPLCFSEYGALQPRLEAARRRLDQELGPRYNEVEIRLMATLESYQSYVSRQDSSKRL